MTFNPYPKNTFLKTLPVPRPDRSGEVLCSVYLVPGPVRFYDKLTLSSSTQS